MSESDSDSDDVQVLSLTERLRRDGYSAPSAELNNHRPQSCGNSQKKKRSRCREVSVESKAKRMRTEQSKGEQRMPVLEISSDMLQNKKTAAAKSRRAVCNANTVRLAKLLSRLFSSSSVDTVCDPELRNMYHHPEPTPHMSVV